MRRFLRAGHGRFWKKQRCCELLVNKAKRQREVICNAGRAVRKFNEESARLVRWKQELAREDVRETLAQFVGAVSFNAPEAKRRALFRCARVRPARHDGGVRGRLNPKVAEFVRFDIRCYVGLERVRYIDRFRSAMQRAVAAPEKRMVGRKLLHREARRLARRCEQLSGIVATRLRAQRNMLFAGHRPDGAEAVHGYSCKTGSGFSASHFFFSTSGNAARSTRYAKSTCRAVGCFRALCAAARRGGSRK
jgi:hypothetical protein